MYVLFSSTYLPSSWALTGWCAVRTLQETVGGAHPTFILGQHVIGELWTIIREIVGGYGYRFFP